MQEQTLVQWDSKAVRSTFISFFVDKYQHTFIPSSSVVPHEDPTLLFANAGMNQFKPIFLGQVDPKSEQAKLKRVANSQKCIRAGGKHNDLDDVGKDTYHHTFFEMLGNWSFGDYFKEEAISWAWELLTEVYKLDKERLYVTYFGGNKDYGLEPDLEAKAIWERYLPPSRVLPFGMKENFWEMGDTGPCGPCSEIHFDKIGGRDAASLVNMDDPDVIEIWNNVFIQFNREPDKSLKVLPAKHVDTGMGLERLTSIIQGVRNNYDTDLFVYLFDEIQKVTGHPVPYRGLVGKDDVGNVDMAYRVIADHIRTLTFAISDGATPGNEGRSYVLRRILRRAIRYGKQILGAPQGFFSQLAIKVVDKMSVAFPELNNNPQHVVNILKSEEELFNRTLDNGLTKFARVLKKTPGNVIAAKRVFKLYTTFGFPIDLTKLMAEEKGKTVDEKGFNELMELAKVESQQRMKKDGKSSLFLDADAVATLKTKLDVTPTEDASKYEDNVVESKLKAIWNGKTYVQSLDKFTDKDLIGLVFDKTNFYAEQGGQIYDTGFALLQGHSDPSFHIEEVQSFGGFVLHMGRIASPHATSLKVGDPVILHVDHARRSPIKSNHTSTHMVNFALRKVLGEGVDQRGSLVDHVKFRFDFSHGKALSAEQLEKVDQIVGDMIAKELHVHAKEVSLALAKKIRGLRAVFGEVYPDPVRVVSIGRSVDELLENPNNDEWSNLSIEFCGGTHLSNTSQADFFHIIQEEALSAGVRRITAVTGQAARDSRRDSLALKERVAKAHSLSGPALTKETTEIVQQLDKAVIPAADRIYLRGQIEALHEKVRSHAKAGKANQNEEAQKYADTVLQDLAKSVSLYHIGVLPSFDNPALVLAAKAIIEGAPSNPAVLFISPNEEKKVINIVAQVKPGSEAALKGIKANEWTNVTAQSCGGKGGGKPDVGNGAGKDLSKVNDAITAAENYVKSILK
eukprot:TRINITY_DN1014_c0_g1_i1.p1 TRINITY_DN1014_c0_g1~~TRINITY_DN1014_c0_g1_i1.p1  ORF type:complete len:964 (-),score=273.64 TRINITY_DN1014_c0_g1_i1:91-2982(-)